MPDMNVHTMSQRGRHAARTARRFLHRRVLFARGRARGLAYRLAGREPNPWVSDDILADRIRSSLGTLEKRLDVPRVHVTVENHVAILHGEVGTEADATAIERAVRNVSGVRGLESYLYIGPLPVDARPSEGRATMPSSVARRRLVEAAREAGGVDDEAAARLVRAVLATFSENLSDHSRRHVFANLPLDVRAIAAPRRRAGDSAIDVRDATDFAISVAAAMAMSDPVVARRVCEAVLGTLREILPPEAGDLTASMPADVRALWDATIAG
jgi:uncharacterized protein (DUF2267 family)